ncbi:YbdD/YjiX family protein [Saxibacter everestensis]|uniref:YbdD/YjiX family protein n=1 Tax=Saxibacter everestensis TaxID=2909229 RepID=A0ABY8QR58_9MICO|nr:YbdD/YjiX family protein [Brevibacteriaceae bacterium ZFBP1038]
MNQVVRAARGIGWYFRELMGDNAYRNYLASWRRTHPSADGCDVGTGNGPMTEREFWRARTDDQDANPGPRCC